jgi:hypothetical protein
VFMRTRSSSVSSSSRKLNEFAGHLFRCRPGAVLSGASKGGEAASTIAPK